MSIRTELLSEYVLDNEKEKVQVIRITTDGNTEFSVVCNGDTIGNYTDVEQAEMIAEKILL